MLKIEILSSSQIEKAAKIFHRDGFVAIANALNQEQMDYVRRGALRVVEEQLAVDPDRKGNRGGFRYSFGQQIHQPEWAMLVDLPHITPILDKIWSSQDYVCSGAGGDYSLPGAQMQPLHKDMSDFFRDPQGMVTFHDTIAPYIVVNFLLTDFNTTTGGTRFVPCTQRHRGPIPTLEEEPPFMRESIIHAPAGTALIRDVRCWHGGPPNNSDTVRIMTSAGYYAPWFNGGLTPCLPVAIHQTLSPRAQHLTRLLVQY